jgi:CTP:phosphocholine cytidylyltransferase-like protein
MKIITLHTRVNIDKLQNYLKQNLNTIFKEQKKSEISFTIKRSGDAIEISEPVSYEGFLFKIEVKGMELWITRSQHYVDDVNSLTVESILNDLFNDLSDKQGTDLILEG